MQGIKRRVIYVSLYEAIALAVCTVGFAAMSKQGLGHSSVLSVAVSVTAVLWNFVFNMLFEAWEARQTVRGRSLTRRITHALGFEVGLNLLLLPLVAWWLQVSLWQALLMNLALAVFFVIYTFVFNGCFDRVFGLPNSAREVPALNGMPQ